MAIDLTMLEETPDVATADTTTAGKKRFVFLRNSKSLTGFVIIAFFAVLAVIGPWIAPYEPGALSADLLQAPSSAHWLGTNQLGQDILSQIIVGTRSVMIVGIIAGVGATAIGVLVGVTSGYIGGIGDEGLSMLANIFLVIPQLPLIIIIAGQLPSAGGVTVAAVIAVTGWAWGARVLRAQTLSLRRRDFVEASKASGESTWRIITAEILPNLTAIIASGFVATVVFAVLTQTTLAFIGIGDPNDWNWGTILYGAQNNQALSRGAWWWFVPAGLCIALVGMALTLINFGIDEFVNPRLRSVGMNAKTLRKRGIRPRIGFTPVVYEAPGASRPSTTLTKSEEIAVTGIAPSNGHHAKEDRS